MSESALMTVKETSEYLGINKYRLYNMIKAPELEFPSFKLNNRIVINRRKLDEWLDNSVGKEYTFEDN